MCNLVTVVGMYCVTLCASAGSLSIMSTTSLDTIPLWFYYCLKILWWSVGYLTYFLDHCVITHHAKEDEGDHGISSDGRWCKMNRCFKGTYVYTRSKFEGCSKSNELK